ncbi:hypothetical protein CYL18_00190 [Pradoshia eiseniae]|uniref:Uncharacterized protein n=1 Tax=Pradoshia eiseniae TaxID=2064768 RepID=A0A2S7N2U8_9BACI|nr:hypothetical protein [Pradoshia eiseniae]PQD96354.1 hypothetical protein CYL18_00190 [Pradoshia eiseniae]
MRRRMNRYNLPPWMQNGLNVTRQFAVPITVFQGIRTFFLPSIVDLLLLFFLIGLVLAFYLEII